MQNLINSLFRKTNSRLIMSDWKKCYEQWSNENRPLPPPHEIKRLSLLDAQQNIGYKVLIETGTYFGEMVEAMAPFFRKIYTVELSEELYKRTAYRLHHLKHVEFRQGDSTEVLPKFVKSLKKPALFWLDGHYSGGVTAQGSCDTPIWAELEAIIESRYSKENAILIDDARCFVSDGEYKDYPTIKAVEEWVHTKLTNHSVDVEDDIIKILPHR